MYLHKENLTYFFRMVFNFKKNFGEIKKLNLRKYTHHPSGYNYKILISI